MLPKIPELVFVLSNGEFVEEFETHNELINFILHDLPEVSQSIILEWSTSELPLSKRESLFDYTCKNLKDFIGESDYILTMKVVK